MFYYYFRPYWHFPNNFEYHLINKASNFCCAKNRTKFTHWDPHVFSALNRRLVEMCLDHLLPIHSYFRAYIISQLDRLSYKNRVCFSQASQNLLSGRKPFHLFRGVNYSRNLKSSVLTWSTVMSRWVTKTKFGAKIWIDLPPQKVILGRKSWSYVLKMVNAEMIDKEIIISWYLNWMFLSFI